MQTRIKMMSLNKAYEYLTKARGNSDFDAHAGVTEAEESYYQHHANMACSDVRKEMTDPETIRSTAETAIGNLEALIADSNTPNQSNSSNIAVYAKDMVSNEDGPDAKGHSVIFLKPFADNLREDFERDGIQYFDTVPAEDMLVKISEFRKAQLDRHVSNFENERLVWERVQMARAYARY